MDGVKVMVIYRAYDIGDKVHTRENLTSKQIDNIQTIFKKFVTTNQKLVKYNVSSQDQMNNLHPLVRFNTQIFQVPVMDRNEEKIDKELKLIADRLLQSETTKVSGGTIRSKSITEGLLFIKLTDSIITIVKLEKSESIDTKSFAIQSGFSTSKEYLKTAVFKKNNFTDITVMDKSNSVAKYWAEKFLGLERSRNSHDNTNVVLDKILDNTIFTPSLIKADYFQEIKNQALDYFANETDFSIDSVFSSINNAQDLGLGIQDIFVEDNALNYDDNFTIDRKAVNKRFSRTLTVSDTISVKSENLRKDVEDGFFIVEDGFLMIRINDTNREQDLKNEIEEVG